MSVQASLDPAERTLPNPGTEPTITVERAGAVLGIGRAAAYAAVRAGEIPSIKLGHRIVVPTAALLRMLDVVPSAGRGVA
jgi:excisionase family DNA binding protein